MGYIMEHLKELMIAFALAIIAAIIYELFHNEFPILLLLSISLLAIAAIGIYNLYLHWKENIEALKKLYSFIGKSSSLKPEDMLGTRPFNPYYYRRQEDDLIDKSLINKNNVLIIGSPIAGKTRALFQALNKLNEPQKIAIPICKDINSETFALPKNTEIIVIDDLHRFVEQQNFDHLFRIAIESNVVIAATCWSEIEYKKVKNKMLHKNILLKTIFENIIELSRVSKDVGKEIADKARLAIDRMLEIS